MAWRSVCRFSYGLITTKNGKHVDRPVNHEAAFAVTRVFDQIAHMPIIDPLRASFSPDAQELFNAWRAELENRIRREKMAAPVESHLAKYRSLMPSIALLLHLADGAQSEEISLLQAQRAAAWCAYLESHARRVYSCATTLEQRLAAQLAEKVKDGCLSEIFVRVQDVYLRGWPVWIHRKTYAWRCQFCWTLAGSDA